MSACTHPALSCINPYEIIRKYRCMSCGGIMMCACEEEFGRRFLPHQLSHATELSTKKKIPVDLGFQVNVCNSCRGLPEEQSPKAPTYGRSSKILRYYWREISMRTTRRFGDWAARHGEDDWLAARRKHKDIYEFIEQQVIAEVKELHNRSPKYVYDEESQSDVLTKNGVEVVRLDGEYAKPRNRRAKLVIRDKTYSPEEFVALHYRQQGYEVIFVESVPFHVIFGVYMWLLIQDPKDTRNRIVGFGERAAFEAGTQGQMIWTLLPEDFGTPGYALRREADIEDYFNTLPLNKADILWTFDYWIEPSANLRQYLWAHRPEHVVRARELVSILPPDVTRRILRYLVKDYWQRYCGWPDLLVYRGNTFFFAEVKSSKDRLSEAQKRWIRGNKTELNLPIKLIKIHRVPISQ